MSIVLISTAVILGVFADSVSGRTYTSLELLDEGGTDSGSGATPEAVLQPFFDEQQSEAEADIEADAVRALASIMFAVHPTDGAFARSNPAFPRQGRRYQERSRATPAAMQFRWPWQGEEPAEVQKEEQKIDSTSTKKSNGSTPYRSKQAAKLKAIGGSPADKALQVNLDPLTYGSFAEIGAGQEVSRTFLQAGAAAGTVAKSLSAYDMQMSDALYGSAKRYVTKERLIQMMDGEYKDLEAYVREGKAAWGGRKPEVRFFSFAATLAAKAYMSDRECEGWVGVTYQHEAGATTRSSILIHVRMSDPTAPLQGEAIGVLGTNLIYLCTNTNDPYVITSFLQDGIEKGRLEIDYIDFQGPAFPDVDPRVVAFRQVQFGLTPSVMLELDKRSDKYLQVVPNDALYKTPVIVQRSRFLPATNTHQEVMAAAKRQVLANASKGDREPKCLNDLQVDDLILPKSFDAATRIKAINLFVDADTDGDGFLSLEELRGCAQLSDEDIDTLLSGDDSGFVEIDTLTLLSDRGPAAVAFLDRLEMLQPLKSPVLVSSIEQTHFLAEYLGRYTNQRVTVAVGGGNYSFSRGLYNPRKYTNLKGGMLEAFGRLFSKNVKIFEYPRISKEDGKISPALLPDGAAKFIHQYLIAEGHLVPIEKEFMSARALLPESNEAFTGGATEARRSIRAGTSEWETYVPEEVAKIAKTRRWFGQVRDGQETGVGDFYDLLKKITT